MSADVETLGGLIRTALYDTGGESVEGAFVDHWVSNASKALAEMESRFEKGGFTRESVDQMRSALSVPGCPQESAVQMLSWLKRWSGPLVRELLESADPALRMMAVGAASSVLPPDEWVRALDDPDPNVRRTAIQTPFRCGRPTIDVRSKLLCALNDPDASVRAAAARSIPFLNDPDSGKVLANVWRTDPDSSVRQAVLEHAAEGSGGYTGRGLVEDVAGPEIRSILIDALNLPAPSDRRTAIRGMRRFSSRQAIEAMFERLLVEESRDVRVDLLANGGFAILGDRAFNLIARILESSADAAERTYAAFDIAGFRDRAVQPLRAALRDPNGPRRAAAMSLGQTGGLAVLPDLVRAIQDPSNSHYGREIDSAIRSVCAVTGEPGRAPTPNGALSERIQSLIRALAPESPHGYGSRLCRDELNSLPVHTVNLFLWSVRADGTILCSNFDRFGTPTEEETDPLKRFAATVQGAMTYPELEELIPIPPRLTYLCHCIGRGWLIEDSEKVECSFCRGMGWFRRPPPQAASAAS